MARITSLEIKNFLDRMGWNYTVIDEETVLTAYPCEIPHYFYQIPIAVTATQYWVTVRGILQGRTPHSREMLALMNELNAQAHLARFVLVDGNAIVQAEIPASRCNVFHLHEALSAVCQYSTRYGLEVSVLATAKSVADLFARIIDQDGTNHNGDAGAGDDWQLTLLARSNRLDDEVPNHGAAIDTQGT